jgi:hypothetical protein
MTSPSAVPSRVVLARWPEPANPLWDPLRNWGFVDYQCSVERAFFFLIPVAATALKMIRLLHTRLNDPGRLKESDPLDGFRTQRPKREE